MRDIDVMLIQQTVARLCKEANFYLPEDVLECLKQARDSETSPVGKEILERILENAEIAAAEQMPLCQDTGLTIVFVEVGQDVHIVGGGLQEAINQGVREGYVDGYLRKSVVEHPFSGRVNTRDNTPAVIHMNIVPGSQFKIMIVPKGGGSENMSFLGMLKPADGRSGVIDFVVNSVEKAGANPCPPIVVGVGIGGTIDQTTLSAKRALIRKVGEPNADAEVAELEAEILHRVNGLGIGPQGLGGLTTALAVHVETYPCHIASMPVVVNIQCHSARHREAYL